MVCPKTHRLVESHSPTKIPNLNTPIIFHRRSLKKLPIARLHSIFMNEEPPLINTYSAFVVFRANERFNLEDCWLQFLRPGQQSRAPSRRLSGKGSKEPFFGRVSLQRLYRSSRLGKPALPSGDFPGAMAAANAALLSYSPHRNVGQSSNDSTCIHIPAPMAALEIDSGGVPGIGGVLGPILKVPLPSCCCYCDFVIELWD